ncbi:probable DNA double-strand break repair Rad50 ATPase [Leptopilina boulardi]|nr:probable DNA double-strand break repair Rad50 ATPase [Leptopilina boulardi]
MQQKSMSNFKEKFSIHCRNVKKSFMNIFPKIDLCEEKCLNANYLSQNDALDITKHLQNILKEIEMKIHENSQKIDKTYQSWSRNCSPSLKVMKKIKNHKEKDNIINENETNKKIVMESEKIDHRNNRYKKNIISSDTESDEILSQNNNFSQRKNMKKQKNQFQKLNEKSMSLKLKNFSSAFKTIKKSLNIINSVIDISDDERNSDSDIQELEENNSPKMKLKFPSDSDNDEEINSMSESKLRKIGEFLSNSEIKEKAKTDLIEFNDNSENEIILANTEGESENKIEKIKENALREKLVSNELENKLSLLEETKETTIEDTLNEVSRKNLNDIDEKKLISPHEKLKMSSYVMLEILDEKLLGNQLKTKKNLSTSIIVIDK